MEGVPEESGIRKFFRQLMTQKEQSRIPEELHLSQVLDQLFIEYESGEIKPETAAEIAYHAIQNFHVQSIGWNAVEAALKQHYTSQNMQSDADGTQTSEL